MKRTSRHSFLRALFVAGALHGAGAVVLAWCVVGHVPPSMNAGAWPVEVLIETHMPVSEERTRGVAPLAVWAPLQPQAVDMGPAALPLVEAPVPQPRHSVPRCIVTPLARLSAAVVVEELAPVAATANVTADITAFPAALAQVGEAGTNEVARTVVADVGADVGGLAVKGTVQPRYPVSARMRGEEGLVALTVETDDEGRARVVTVTAPSGFPALDRAAVDAANRARFVSTTAGVPARGKLAMSFRFRLVD